MHRATIRALSSADRIARLHLLPFRRSPETVLGTGRQLQRPSRVVDLEVRRVLRRRPSLSGTAGAHDRRPGTGVAESEHMKQLVLWDGATRQARRTSADDHAANENAHAAIQSRRRPAARGGVQRWCFEADPLY